MTGGEQEALKRLHRVCADVDYAASAKQGESEIWLSKLVKPWNHTLW